MALTVMAYYYWAPHLARNLKPTLAIFLMGLFVCCMVGHGELSARKPHPRYLTGFYCMVGLGGAVGGLLVAILAPIIFSGYFELPIGLSAFGLLILALTFRISWRMRVLWTVVCVFLMLSAFNYIDAFTKETLMAKRNFYGSIRVEEFPAVEEGDTVRTLIHGTIDHGRQFLSSQRRRQPTTYYGHQSGIGLTLDNMGPSPVRVGVIGLGTGTLAAYGRPGDYYCFYEINPLVVEVARNYFTFLSDSRAEVKIVLGDGRLSLDGEPPQEFDVLALDAFSGDAIPVHLLSREAFQLYFRHLKPEGVLALHVTNRSLDLPPVVQKTAQEFNCRRPANLQPGVRAG